jgi:hypothetical protein
MTTYSAGQGTEVVVVDADAMQDLTDRYAEYHEVLYGGGAFDPLQALHLTGGVLASVREVITTTGPVPSIVDPPEADRPGQ